jgi:protein TonB
MEKKKSNRANLENKKGIVLEIGFIISLTLMLAAFEWRTSDNYLPVLQFNKSEVIEELLPVNTTQKKPLPPPPVPRPVYTINPVDNNDPVPDDFPKIDAGDNPDNPIPDYLPALPEDKPDPGEDTVFLVVEKMPEFPGGETELYRFLGKNVRYPQAAREVGISGTVNIGFVVEKDGSLSSLTILRSPHALLSEEALRVMSLMPAWSPGEQRGKQVRVSFSIPFKFTLQ